MYEYAIYLHIFRHSFVFFRLPTFGSSPLMILITTFIATKYNQIYQRYEMHASQTCFHVSQFVAIDQVKRS